ncbi:DNA helicase/exodeoxyribonuclease V, subunit A [Terribacillus aidingensis]|uniref:ATP-dependent helicase/nuclease subunit A n=1 Tax=Terribacillus aidingensis TaxID=586416 RepID=A0A285NXW8_9BACI|nr:helicase-exonuclease AddAB subunit AddA [Terribacillus aidingensis]SNZ14334.1 DNA helicase/exodeoxyribonuclease V, subunit A [Terribacillus aidingensis]
MVQWTNEQQLAIDAKGHDILVAAAAGSGKTAVLVERIIQKLVNQDDPVDIDQLLVVTFTNAAAQEMRSRIGTALEKALEADSSSQHLRKQLSLLQHASISTLHSFCLDVVRKYAYMLDLDPSFRIADDLEADLIRQEVMGDLLEEWYGKEGEEQAAFFGVVDRFSNDRNDLEVEDLILKLYDFATQNPYPDTWLDQMAQLYDVTAIKEETELPWLQVLKREANDQLQAMLQEADQALALTREPDGPYHYAETFEAEKQFIAKATELVSGSWNDAVSFIKEQSFGRLPAKKVECDDTKKAQAKALRDSYKKRWGKLAGDWFARNLEVYLADMQELYPSIQQLALLVKQFRTRYQSEKRERALVDFSDLEHFCLEVLIDENSTPEHIIPSAIAESYQSRFKELLLDEYQDTNLVQETLVTLLSDRSGSGNMFMVGDVKQSIYRFRHAEPSLFLNKYKAFSEAEHPGMRIDLASNFRSRQQVLDGANYIFRQLFSEDVGEMQYEKEAELIYANKMYDELKQADTDVELLVINRDGSEESYEADTDTEMVEDLEKAQLEGRAYARMIQQWIGHEGEGAMQVVDKSTQQQRDLQYRDIVILLRSMTWAPAIVDELKQQGIPVYAELSTGYLEAIEIKVMMSVLKIIDNPLQDIPFAAVLRSPIIGLKEDDLAKIRLADQRSSYFEAARSYAKTANDAISVKIERLLEWLDSWRMEARQGALSALIWSIMRETGYYDFVGGIPGGRQRQANLRALYDRARNYENTSFRGLFRFVKFIERMEERGDDLGAAKALGEQEDVVRIMTIHKSKGLEFPVVITGAMDKMFNQQDLRERYLLHKDLGFGSKYIDPAKRLMYPTLIYHALKAEKQRESLAEEMRVLYVALTRAKEKLVMVGNVASLDKKLQKWRQIAEHPDWVLPSYYRLEATSYLDWVAPALMRHEQAQELRADELTANLPQEITQDQSKWRISLQASKDYVLAEERKEEANQELLQRISNWQSGEENADWKAEVEDRLTYRYPYAEATRFRAKQTVTEIKRQREIRDSYSDIRVVNRIQQRASIASRPRFLQESKELTPAERGSAVHAVLQQLDLHKEWSKQKLDEFLLKLVENEFLQQEALAAIDGEKILDFLASPLAERIRQAEQSYRETPFTLALPANELYNDWSGAASDKVVVQGVIDQIIAEDDGLVLLDYKTDTLFGDDPERRADVLTEKYRVQIELYANAIERIWKKPVKERYLYFFDKGILRKL